MQKKNSIPANYDRIDTIGASRIQHGKHNNRIYLMHLDAADGPALLPQLDGLANKCGYTKIFAKVPAEFEVDFLSRGYRLEAVVPRFFRGRRRGLFLCKYFDSARAQEESPDKVRTNLIKAQARKRTAKTVRQPLKLPAALSLRVAGFSDAAAISAVYKQVFASYPFPVHDTQYIRQTMQENVVYFCIESRDGIIAVSSAEMAAKQSVVEMTDFATLPVCRGRGFARILLAEMEREMQQRGIKTAYTIARAMSGSINAVFSVRGYKYSGTLTKNTQICGSLESMNVWHKPLAA